MTRLLAEMFDRLQGQGAHPSPIFSFGTRRQGLSPLHPISFMVSAALVAKTSEVTGDACFNFQTRGRPRSTDDELLTPREDRQVP